MAAVETSSESIEPTFMSDPDQLTEQNMKIHVQLQGVAETLFISLAARAFDASTHSPILGDPYAIDVLDKLDYDFDGTVLSPTQCATMMLRTRHFDRCVASFLAAHPRSTVLHLACGLDSRVQRLKWDSDVCWIDVDLPEVIALRRQVLPHSFSRCDYRLVGANVTDGSWLENIPADRPTIIAMEGLLSYLMKDDVERLLSRLAEKYPGGELLFECINGAMLSTLRKGLLKAADRTGAEFHWSVDDPKTLQDVHPHLEMLESTSIFEARGVEDLPLTSRAAMYLMSWIPSIRDRARFLRFRINPELSRRASVIQL